MRRRAAWAVLAVLLLIVAVSGGGAFWVRARLLASLPVLDGEVTVPRLQGPVTVTRDGLGIPTIHGRSREDVARATGFLHAQDRFFQMDLSRRRAAGELAALVGSRALIVDRETRMHRLRAVARRTVDRLPARDRRILSAYVSGVNAGLEQLGAPPFEYLMLRQPPERWREEDTILVVLSMFLTLQDSEGLYDSTLATIRRVLPAAVARFVVPPGTEWDTPVSGETFAVPPVPGPETYNLRSRRHGKHGIELPPPRQDLAIGSNNFAVAGRLTRTGGALVANDMHLAVRVPNTWYRAVYMWESGADGTRILVGATLPGHPAMVIGSNTQVAWGFTNTYGDFSDVVIVETDPRRPGRYRAPDGWRTFDHYDERIRVAGGQDEQLDVVWTIWGPVIAPDYRGRTRALRWVAHSLDELQSTMTPLEDARSLEEAFDEANGLGAPGQNMVAGDRSGRIGWSIYGAIPRRTGTEGDLPTSWADATAGWAGWLSDAEYPRVIDPPSGRLWSANARVADGAALGALGHGNFEVGSRARIIRDRLSGRDQFTAGDLLAVQMDTSAVFLSRWRELIMRTLTPAATGAHPQRQEFRDVVERTWTGQASPGSAGYRLTRMFRERVSEHVFAFLLSECYEADPGFDYRVIRLREGPIWKLLSERPAHLLDPAFKTWDDLLLASVDEVIARLRQDEPGPLSERVWSEFNRTVYRHPLSGAVPFLSRWLDMPEVPLAGDLYTPNMHWGANGPSERMIVSPGRESEGIMHMPTGQSGHPLSPFYGNSHPAWLQGEATPLMPGPAEHSLVLVP